MNSRKNKINIYKLFIAGIFIFFISNCKKENNVETGIEEGIVTDIDNNIYKTIKIGNQWWMAENLKVKTFRNGVPIQFSQLDIQWKDTIGAYCIFDNNASAPGLLYNWYSVVNINNLAPIGWHIPNDDEWKELEKYLGIDQLSAGKQGWRGTTEGEKLKIQGTQGWTAYSGVWPTNESGFNALAGGCRLFNGVWGDPGLFATGFWWSSTEVVGKGAYYRYLDYKKSNIFRSYTNKNYGFSIRCVKD